MELASKCLTQVNKLETERMPRKLPEVVKHIRRCATKMKLFLDSQVDLTTVLFKRIRIAFKLFSPRKLIEELVSCFNGNHKRVKFKIKSDSKYSDADQVLCDREKVREVLYHLIDNSVRYAHEDVENRIFITFGVSDVPKSNGLYHFVVKIKDNGPGIPQPQLEDI
mmetsp:Transcript_4468/g.6647  ORF Transcript_4468/g.6647 Transcript_4468/m.6647 type:complete len:166 (+) Transcript_4468:1310-1807(+)